MAGPLQTDSKRILGAKRVQLYSFCVVISKVFYLLAGFAREFVYTNDGGLHGSERKCEN